MTGDYLVGAKTLFPVTSLLNESHIWPLNLDGHNSIWNNFLEGDDNGLVDMIFDIDDTRYQMIAINGEYLTDTDYEPFKKLIQLLITYWPHPIAARLNRPDLIKIFLQYNPGRSLVIIDNDPIELQRLILQNGGIIQKIN